MGFGHVDRDLGLGEDPAVAFLELAGKSVGGLSRRHHRPNQGQGNSTVRRHLDGPTVLRIPEEFNAELVGAEVKEVEELAFADSGGIWRLVEKRRKQECITRAELERRIAAMEADETSHE